MGRFLVITLGVVLLIAAVFETKLRWESDLVPTRYSMRDLEAGAPVSNRHAIIDGHYAIYDRLVFSCTKATSDGQSMPGPEQYIKHLWYPIVSEKPQPGTTPDAFRILVKMDGIGMRVKDRPRGVARAEELTGLFMDDWHSLGKEERTLLQQSFPTIDFSKVLLFEPGRKPAPFEKIVGLAAGGLLLVLLAIFWREPQGKYRARRWPDHPEQGPAKGVGSGERPW